MKEAGTASNKKARGKAGTYQTLPTAMSQLRRRLGMLWARLPVRFPRALVRQLTRPQVVAAFGLFAVTTAIIAAHCYVDLAREIDLRLYRQRFFDSSVDLLTSPFKLAVGDRLSFEEVIEYLEKANYRRSMNGEDDSPPSFFVERNTIEIRPETRVGGWTRIPPVRIEVDARGRVSSITDLETDGKLETAEIEGELLASLRGGDRRKRTLVRFDEIPAQLRRAVLAAEDRRFFSHPGVDWRGIVRALWIDLTERKIVQGGSTITQQLVKNAFLSRKRTLARKVKEAALALVLESRIPKEQIFSLYCSEVYLGHEGSFAVHGFVDAADLYFGKRLADLTVGESAFLAGLIHAPNRYLAHKDPDRVLQRRNQVLEAMVEIGAISPKQAADATREALSFKTREGYDDHGARHFIDYVQEYLDARMNSDLESYYSGILTTMDPRLQRAASEAVRVHAKKLDKAFGRAKGSGTQPRRVEAALVALDARTGEVLAMVGGRDYDTSQLNRATDARRQPGSAFKPFVYATALNMRSYTAATLIADRPSTIEYDGGRSDYSPSNYGGGFSHREITVREAMARSLNVPAVELASRVGYGNIATVAEKCGLERPHVYPSMGLGTAEVSPLELAAGFTVFANGGTALRPVPVRGLTPAGYPRSVVSPSKAVRVFSPALAYVMTSLMQSVVDTGTASKVRRMGLKGAVAGKTGTSNDGWFAGYTPGLVCVVWVGFDDNTDMKMKASDTALPVWVDFVKRAIEIRPGLGGGSFPQPAGVVEVEIDPGTGYLASPYCAAKRQEVFISGTEPFITCSHDLYSESGLLSEYNADYSTGEDQHLDLDVCSETGLFPSAGCKTTPRSYQFGEGPIGVCRPQSMHGEPPGFVSGARSFGVPNVAGASDEGDLDRTGSRPPGIKENEGGLKKKPKRDNR